MRNMIPACNRSLGSSMSGFTQTEPTTRFL